MAAAAAAACRVDPHGFSRRRGAHQLLLPGRVHFFVAGARNSKKLEHRRGIFRARYFGVNFYKCRSNRISEIALIFPFQPERHRSLCSRRRLCSGFGNADNVGRGFLVPSQAVATGGRDWGSRWEDSEESRAEFWRVWNFNPSNSGDRLAVLGILALTGLAVVRLLRGSSFLSLGAIILFLFIGGFHQKLKPGLFFLGQKLQHLKGNFIGNAPLVHISFKQQTSGSAADSLLSSLYGSSALQSAEISSSGNGNHESGEFTNLKGIAKSVDQFSSITQNLDSESTVQDSLTKNDLMSLQLGIIELRKDLYRAVSALQAKESVLQLRLQSSAGASTFEITSHDSPGRETAPSSDLMGKRGVDMKLTEESGNVDSEGSPGFSVSEEPLSSSNYVNNAGKKILEAPACQVITADLELEPVAHFSPGVLKIQATASSLSGKVATLEIDSNHDELGAETEHFRVSSYVPEQIIREPMVAVDTPEFTSDTADESGWSFGDSIDMKTGFQRKGRETLIGNKFSLSLDAPSLSSVNRTVAEESTLAYREDQEPVSVIVMDTASTDPWHDVESSFYNSLVTNEYEDSHRGTPILQDTITPSPSVRWTDDDNDEVPHASSIKKGQMYIDVGGKGRNNAEHNVDFWGSNTATAGRPERGTLTRMKANRKGSLGSVDDVNNELPEDGSSGYKNEQMSQRQVRRRESGEGVRQQTTSGNQDLQDGQEFWDNESAIDEAVSKRRSTRGSQGYQENERGMDVRKISADDRKLTYDGRGSPHRKMIEEEEDYGKSRKPDSRYYPQERIRSYQGEDDAEILNEEEEEFFREAGDMKEEYFGNESRSWVADDVGLSKVGGDMRRNSSSRMKMSSNSRVPINTRNRRQNVDDDDEDDSDEDGRYRLETRNLVEDEQDYGGRRKGWVESQYPATEVQRGSDYEPESKRRNTDPASDAQKESEPEERNLPVRQPSRLQLEKFDRLLDEGEALLEQGMQGLEGRIEVGVAERMLYEAANLFEAAAEIDPSSVIAVGFWGNTLLVHGELKVKLSQQLRSMLPSPNSYSMSRARTERDDQRESLELTLQIVCEECEELLVDAGRKYRMALSLDRTDMRALYNWGLALCYRGQLIADEGGERAIQDADKVYLAAIDKFEAMLGISQEYAAGALYNWGLAMRDRARLRPMGDGERVKLLLQAKELFQDSVRLDPDNGQARGAVTAAMAELQELKRFEDMQNERESSERSSRSWWQ